MFFILSQLLSFLVMPLSICLAFILIGYIRVRKNKGRGFLLTGIVLLLFFSNQFISNWAMNQWEPEVKPFSSLPNYEWGIVLTGVTNINKEVNDRTFFNKGADRATHAIQLYKLGKIEKILITGGMGLNPQSPSAEAILLKNVMVIAGVPEEAIALEGKALNTRQNALFSKEILNQMQIPTDQKHLLITSAFHMRRSKGCFDKVEINTDTFPVDYYGHSSKYDLPTLLYPDPYAIFKWQKLFNEWVGLTVYKIVGYV
ncbi:YdcF family protein [Belliella sp. DSM 111904]|uniref:YdcF family protein n=2 Tax=Belliella filtrata TaxID=2923435 RepID=A0ABS9V2E1_9BACT|nr:YdcF family protein [Belliella filtrata]MCH7410370.1 YdcF family protein [Belliella filtrata]